VWPHFQELASLQILDLTSNQLTDLPAGCFTGLDRLHTLKLSANQLASLRPDSLRGLAALNTLTLENNSLAAIHPGALSGLAALQDLNLFGNSLAAIPEALRAVSSLKTVDLGRNGIQRLEPLEPAANSANNNSTAAAVANLPPRLIGLKLDQNQLEAVTTASLAGLQHLQILNLASNQISTVARGAFAQNRRLQAIRLDANRITDIVGLFSDLASLRWLNISDNRIQKFDYFLLPRSLNWLDIHRNQIEDIGNYFDKEAELGIHTMDISFNRLRSVSAKAIPDRVQILSLNDNLITRIDPLTFANKRHLVRVDLYANQIVRLEPSSIRLSSAGGAAGGDDDVIGGMAAAAAGVRPEFYLGGNPFLCDCNLEWLKTINTGGLLGASASAGSLQPSTSTTNYPVVRDLESIYCRLMYSPENAYIPLVEARSAEFLCPYTAHCFALCHCCDFDACDCEMTCPDNCTCYHDQAWSTNIVDCTSAAFLEPPTTIPMDATEVYLHGNNFHVLSSHSFIGRKNLRVLYLNHSNIEAVLNYTFFGLRRLAELHLDHNSIRRLEGHEFQSLRGLRVLYLDHNRISYIDQGTFAHLDSLEVLRLHNNQLMSAVPGRAFALLGSQNPYLVEVTLAANPWSCECELAAQLAAWLADNSAKVADASKVACLVDNGSNGGGGLGRYFLAGGSEAAAAANTGSDCGGHLSPQTVTLSDNNSEAATGHHRLLTDRLPLLIVGVSLLTVLLVVLGVVLYYRTEIRVLIFHRWGVRLCHRTPDDDGGRDNNKMYDAYVAYTIKDEQFVGQVLSPELEHSGVDPALRLCLHYRDLPANAYVADSMLEAVQASRRTVLVLSRHFILHEWSRYDIRSALHDVLTGGQGRDRRLSPALVIVLGDIPHREMDPDLRACLRRSIVIRWSDRLFWSKLRFYLPPSPKTASSVSGGGSATSSYSTSSSSSPPGRRPGGVAVPNYCVPIYEVPHQVGSGVGGGIPLGPPHPHLNQKAYEQRTLEYQLCEKLY
jgi:Leucine-rich repeat (LRR) protein